MDYNSVIRVGPSTPRDRTAEQIARALRRGRVVVEVGNAAHPKADDIFQQVDQLLRPRGTTVCGGYVHDEQAFGGTGGFVVPVRMVDDEVAVHEVQRLADDGKVSGDWIADPRMIVSDPDWAGGSAVFAPRIRSAAGAANAADRTA